jgi:hypothetical protein
MSRADSGFMPDHLVMSRDQNPNLEIRNKFKIRMSKTQGLGGLWHWDFEIWICVGFRVLNFGFVDDLSMGIRNDLGQRVCPIGQHPARLTRILSGTFASP